jgi:hypothetical protein
MRIRLQPFGIDDVDGLLVESVRFVDDSTRNLTPTPIRRRSQAAVMNGLAGQIPWYTAHRRQISNRPPVSGGESTSSFRRRWTRSIRPSSSPCQTLAVADRPTHCRETATRCGLAYSHWPSEFVDASTGRCYSAGHRARWHNSWPCIVNRSAACSRCRMLARQMFR